MLSVNNQFAHLFNAALLAEIARVGILRTVEAGTILMQPGDLMLFVPIVLNGSIKILRPNTETDGTGEILLYYLNANDACALSFSSVLTGQTSQIIAVADEKTTLFMVPTDCVDAWMGQFADWRAFIFQTYQKRFDGLLQTFDSVAFQQMDERLLAYLNHRAELTGGRHLYTTHEAIAQDLNTSREVISRLLKQLERLGKVVLARNKISLVSAV